MITKIIQVSDIHIRNLRRLDEYKEQLAKFVEECNGVVKNNTDGDTRIVVCGDVFHNKTDISPEAYALAFWFFKQLDNICPTIVIAGNHDINMSNVLRLDPISVLFQTGQFKQVSYLDRELGYQSGIYKDDNIVWCLYSAFSKFEKPDIFNARKEYGNDLTYVALFHGDMKSAKTDVGYVFESGYDCSYFGDVNFGLFGHVHKRQCINNDGIKLVYSGSLIQQDHGENINGHGYLVWDVDSETYEEVDIANTENGFYTFEISDESDIENNNEKLLNLG